MVRIVLIFLFGQWLFKFKQLIRFVPFYRVFILLVKRPIEVIRSVCTTGGTSHPMGQSCLNHCGSSWQECVKEGEKWGTGSMGWRGLQSNFRFLLFYRWNCLQGSSFKFYFSHDDLWWRGHLFVKENQSTQTRRTILEEERQTLYGGRIPD